MINRLEMGANYFTVLTDRRTVNDEPISTATGDFHIMSNGTLFISMHATIRNQDEVVGTLEKLHEALNGIEDEIVVYILGGANVGPSIQ
mgnify:FL=1